jgi:hypothetical protein
MASMPAVALVSGLVTAAVSILSGVFVGLLQIISLKKATEGKPVVPGEVINESKKFIPRALQYGLFVVAVVVASAIVIGLVSAAIGPVGALLGLAFVVAMIIAAFRYAFLQYIVVESHEMAFMDRFKLSQKLTDGIYGTIFLAALMGFVLGIGAGLVSGALSSPFKTSTKNIDTTFQTRFDNVQTEEDFYDAFDDARDEVAKQSLDANYVIRQIITGVISWGVGLITMGAFLELYKELANDIFCFTATVGVHRQSALENTFDCCAPDEA